MMKPQDAKSIGVLGFGIMGHTWATALLTGDLEVHVFERSKEAIDNNRGRTKKYLQRLVEKNKVHVLMGGASSGVVLACMDYLKRYNKVFMSTGVSSSDGVPSALRPSVATLLV